MSTVTQPVESKPKLITRKDMIAMTGLSWTKVHNLTMIKGFQKIQGKRDREYLLDEQAVLAWFKANNPKETAAPQPSQPLYLIMHFFINCFLVFMMIFIAYDLAMHYALVKACAQSVNVCTYHFEFYGY